MKQLQHKVPMEESGSDDDDDSGSETSYKLAVVVRTDLGMTAGKLAAQVGHSVQIVMAQRTRADLLKLWEDDGGMIVVLQVASESDLRALQQRAQRDKIVTSTVIDEGLTEVDSGVWTTLAVGPDEVSRVDGITGKLQLYRSAAEVEAEELRRKLLEAEAELARLRQSAAHGVHPAIGSSASSAQGGKVWYCLELTSAGPATPVCPELFEQWCWEGDPTCLPYKWTQAVEECCNGQVAFAAERPWEAPGFDDQGIFFLTSRSETCGIAVALPAFAGVPGGGDGVGVVAAWGVKPWCQRRGLGRCLLRLCLQRHSELGRRKVFCAVDPQSSPGACKLLIAEGFQPAPG